jgi:hypothetical protein
MLGELIALAKSSDRPRIVDFWNDPQQLCTQVVIAVGQAVTLSPGIGWIRGDQAVGAGELQMAHTKNKAPARTEMEYEYAIQKQIPVLAFLHANPDKIESGKTDRDAEQVERLVVFRNRLSKGRIAPVLNRGPRPLATRWNQVEAQGGWALAVSAECWTSVTFLQ